MRAYATDLYNRKSKNVSNCPVSLMYVTDNVTW
jgi:hypothetical protein